MKKVFICAGELSGDRLGAGLIQAVKKLYPDVQFTGIAGPDMIAAGCESLYPIETLSVMGLLEIIPKLPKILSLRHQIIKNLLKNPPDLYIGIDAPDFNLPIETRLKSHNIKTLHYVSPTVWAWRAGRVKQIKKAVDSLLCIFPFEKEFLAENGVPVHYIGHRSADTLPGLYTQEQAREILKLNSTDKIMTILPGSRSSEINKMTELFLKTALWCWKKNNKLKFIIAAANNSIAAQIELIISKTKLPFVITIITDKTYAAIKAADAVLATSGTVTLETFLLDKPMAVAYKMNFISWQIVRALVQVKFCALPNLLAKKQIIPEFLQNDATPEHLGQALMHWLENPQAVVALQEEYKTILQELRCKADNQAAQAVVDLLD